MNKYEQFLREWRRANDCSWFSFEWIDDPGPVQKELNEYFFSGAGDQIIPFGRHQSGSLLGYWLNGGQPEKEPAHPIAWIDSEANPIALMAQDMGLFLTALPYGIPLLYDICVAWDLHQRLPAKHPAPTRKKSLRDHMRTLKEQFPKEVQAYLAMVRHTFDDIPELNPVEIVEQANQFNPAFAAWFRKGLGLL